MFGSASDEEQDLRIISYLHDQIIEASGGAKGIHSEHLLKSALARPLQTAFGEEILKTRLQKPLHYSILLQIIMAFVMEISVRQWRRQASSCF